RIVATTRVLSTPVSPARYLASAPALATDVKSPVVNARFDADKFKAHPVSPVKTKFRVSPAKQQPTLLASDLKPQTQPSELDISSFIHEAAVQPQTASPSQVSSGPSAGNTMLIVVQDCTFTSSGDAIYRFSVWRVVFHPADNQADHKVPQKET